MVQANGIKYLFYPVDRCWAIVGAEDGMQFAASVKESIDGYPVTTIGDNAFANSQTLTGIVLPNTIRRIGVKAFANCKNLQYVSFVNKLETTLIICEGAFNSCTSLKRFQATGRFAHLKTQAFVNCPELHYIDCKIKTIEFNAFSNCKDLNALIFADRAKLSSRSWSNCNIEYAAFVGDVTVPNVESFLSLFSDCKIFATDKFSYWDLAYDGLHLAPRQTIE